MPRLYKTGVISQKKPFKKAFFIPDITSRFCGLTNVIIHVSQYLQQGLRFVWPKPVDPLTATKIVKTILQKILDFCCDSGRILNADIIILLV